MARTKGITLKVRKAAEEASTDPTTITAASTSEAQPQADEPFDVATHQPDEEMVTAESSRGAASSRSRSARLSRTRSHEEAFGAEASSSRTTPSRRSRRQPTKQEEQDLDQDVEMGSLQQPSDQDAGQNDAEVDAASTPRSRSTRTRIKSSTTPVPQAQVTAASRSTRSPRKAPRVSVVGRRGSNRSKGTPADEEEASEQPGDAAEQQEEHGADDDANVPDAGDGGEDEGEDDAEDDADEDADGDGDGDGDGDNDDEEGVDEEGHKIITVKGTKWRLEDDKEEVILPSDPEGDKKVDEKGRLQGGRTYKAYNFTSDERSDPEKVYMLAIDAARSAGYRDSLYFFRRNPQIFKIELTQGEKEKLIDDGRLSGQLRTRNVTMVPARNVYKLHGARFLSGGKAIVDDYYEAEARASGVKEGKTVGGMSMEEQEKRREAERERERPKKKADVFSYTTIDPQGDPAVTQFGDAGQAPWVRAGNWQSRKAALQRMDITEENWMLEMARSVRGMNTELNETRRDRLSAFPRFNRYLDVDDAVAPSDEVKEEIADGEAEPEDDPEALNDLPPWEREKLPVVTAEEQEEESEKRKTALQESLDAERRRGPPIGVYEPNTHLPHFSVLTQPTQAAFVKVAQRPAYIDDQAGARGDRRPILGGDKLGSGAWGVASISVECLPPARLPGHVAVPAGEEGTAPATMPSA